jgi:hypothetical protein
MLSAGFEPATPETKWPQMYALDRAATGIGSFPKILQLNVSYVFLIFLWRYSQNRALASSFEIS